VRAKQTRAGTREPLAYADAASRLRSGTGDFVAATGLRMGRISA